MTVEEPEPGSLSLSYDPSVPGIKESIASAKAAYDARMAAAKAGYEERVKQPNPQITELDRRGRLAAVWDGQKQALDDQFRRCPSKGAGPKGFGRPIIIGSRVDSYVKYDSTSEYLVRALHLEAFIPGTALLLGFNLDKKENGAWARSSGHAIAMHHESSASQRLFDPNLGVYSFKDRDKLAKAVLALCEEGYGTGGMKRLSQLDKGGDCHVFARDDYEDQLADYLLHPSIRAGLPEIKRTWASGVDYFTEVRNPHKRRDLLQNLQC